jgi:hypothetical protein
MPSINASTHSESVLAVIYNQVAAMIHPQAGVMSNMGCDVVAGYGLVGRMYE